MATNQSAPVTGKQEWTIEQLQKHIQYAVDLEFWTIPFYMSAMYSVIDRSSEAFQLTQSVVHQEMLHLQSASNIANVYGLSPTFQAPIYKGKKIPHLNFKLDKPDPTPKFEPYTAEIGPMDLAHINAMCLIEFPEWDSKDIPDLKPNVTEYANIGEFYLALRHGADELKNKIHGGVKQVDLFSNFYRNMPAMTITESGGNGFYQVALLIDLITDQGEGNTAKDQDIQVPFQNTADDREQDDSHYKKFLAVKNGALPKTYPVKPVTEYTTEDKRLLEILLQHFTELRNNLQLLFAGNNPEEFYRLMFSVGADIQNCWKHGVTPRFS